MECMLYGFKNPLILSEFLNYCENYIKFYFKLKKKKVIQEEFLNLEDGNYRSFQNVGNNYCSLHNIPEEWRTQKSEFFTVDAP